MLMVLSFALSVCIFAAHFCDLYLQTTTHDRMKAEPSALSAMSWLGEERP